MKKQRKIKRKKKWSVFYECSGRSRNPLQTDISQLGSLYRLTLSTPSQFYSPTAESFGFLGSNVMASCPNFLQGSVEAALQVCLLKPAANNNKSKQREKSLAQHSIYFVTILALILLTFLFFLLFFLNTFLVAQLRILTHFHTQSCISRLQRGHFQTENSLLREEVYRAEPTSHHPKVSLWHSFQPECSSERISR